VPDNPYEQAVRQLLDRAEIGAAMAAYARCADLNRPDEQAAVFADDGRVRFHPTDWVVGRAAVAETLRVALTRYRQTSHHVSNVEIDFDGPDAAEAQSVVLAWHRRTDGSEWTLHGRYVDRWVRASDGWRLYSREIRAAGAVGRDDRELNPLGRS
jgi:hypothetical protein